MPARSDEELRGLVSEMTMRLLVNAADAGQQERLKRAIRDWYPDTSTVDEFELRRVTEAVREGFRGMANLVDERLERLVESGRAVRLSTRAPQ